MKTALILLTFGLGLVLLSAIGLAADAATDASGKLRVLVITGGHDFEKEPFFKVFQDNPLLTSRSSSVRASLRAAATPARSSC